MNDKNDRLRIGYIDKMKSNARAIISFQIGIPQGIKRMTKLITWIENISPIKEIDIDVFVDCYNEMDDIGIGSDRLEYSIELLEKEDKLLNEILNDYRHKILQSCYTIIKTEENNL